MHPKLTVKVSSFIDVYRSILAWNNEPNCLLVHFEDLVDKQGGGDTDKQENVAKNIALFLGIKYDANIAAKVSQIYNPSARTFRIGKIDSWKNSMDEENIKYLSEYC